MRRKALRIAGSISIFGALIKPIIWVIERGGDLEFVVEKWPEVWNIVVAPWFPFVALIAGLVMLYFALRHSKLIQPQPIIDVTQSISHSGKEKPVGMVATAIANTIHEQKDNEQQLIEAMRIKEPEGLEQQELQNQQEGWWEQYRPYCEIVKVDSLKITKNGDKYHFELSIDVKYTSRDTRFSTRMDCTTILLDVFHTGTDREKTPYRLHSSALPLRMEPSIEGGGYHVEMQQKWDLPSTELRVIRYTFIGQEEGEPLIENETSCKITAIGIPIIHNVNINKPLKVEDSKFPITVVDGQFVVKIDKRY